MRKMKSEENQGVLDLIERAVPGHNPELLDQGLEQARQRKIPVHEIKQTLFQGLERSRKKLLTREAPLPNFLLSLEVLDRGFQKLSATADRDASAIPLVIGVVEGDPHDLGKNIVARIYAASGYQVHDLGVQVPAEAFVNSVREKRPKILALSSMISTTMVQMPEIIKRVKALAPDTVVMVGGAPLDLHLAKSFGADGYAESAVTLLEETEAARERVSAREKW